MGWTGYPGDWRSSDEIVREEIEYGGTHKVLAKSGRYLAVQDTRNGEVFAVVALVEGRKGDYATKLMSEHMGPFYYAAPKRIMDLLTEAPNADAREWRRKVAEYREAKAAMPTLRKGDVVIFDTPVALQGVTYKVGKATYAGGFRFDCGGFYMRLPRNWKTRYQWHKA